MNRADELLKLDENTKSIELAGGDSTETGDRRKVYIKYSDVGNKHRPMPKDPPPIPTVEVIKPGVYVMGADMGGVFYEKHKYATDELLRFEDSRYESLLNEIESFYEMEGDFKQFGFSHSHAICLTGTPGTGKSCIIKIAEEGLVKEGHPVFLAKDMWSLVEGLKLFREVEPDRKAFVVLEDLDTLIEYKSTENKLLELLDGDSQVNGIMYIATTNYPERIPDRIKRIGRFSEMLEIDFPPEEGRRAYLQHKLGTHESEDEIERIVKATEGLGFNHLKNYILSVYVFKKRKDETILRLKNTIPEKVMAPRDKHFGKVCCEAFSKEITESRASRLLSEEDNDVTDPSDDDSSTIHKAMEDKIHELGFEGVFVDKVIVDPDGDVIIAFSDDDNDRMEVLFGYDDDEGAFAMLFDDDEDLSAENAEVIIVDLDTLIPPTYENEFGAKALDMKNLSWLNKSALHAVFKAGDIGADNEAETTSEREPEEPEEDVYGNPIPEESWEHEQVKDGEEVVQEVFRKVVRGGAVIKLPVLRKKRKKILSPRQKAALRKATMKAKTGKQR
jgi:hypothetical protein